MGNRKKVIYTLSAVVIAAAVLFIFYSVKSHEKNQGNEQKKSPNTHIKQPRPKQIRIVALGDSLTYGRGDPQRKGYIGLVRQGMQKELKRPVVLNNYGISGQRSDQLYKQLSNGMVSRSVRQANYIFLFIGTNDYRKTAGWNFRNINQKEMAIGQKVLYSNLEKITAELRNQNKRAHIYILGLYNPYTENFYDEVSSRVIKRWNGSIQQVSAETPNSTYISTYELFVGIQKQNYFSDSIHPNPKGYYRIAQRVLGELKLR
ncbi:GDSL-type esterase/lipase family protein [Fictibacillus sp. WQ 8-8]|uniref:GDSL-type esterase/lipase family protein n=1 Tax=Fictibacillus sp. WQ 8-8 TaxID=2938788 RepID=UPI00210C397E|nr:GDSL-type esterase/lipase family protein [Fictibacillus sp. WQ 8-8]MCQ6266677.1 GDSL-type esterase/lipase family protein [Fictibacillus sp. WQ 8-8]